VLDGIRRWLDQPFDLRGMLTSRYTRKADENFDVELPWVSDGYLQTLGIPLLAGRYFVAADTATSQKVAIVNESFAGTQAGNHLRRAQKGL
jgi:hypothetical protein